MTEQCDYCGDSVSEGEYLSHLRTEHYDELRSIDRRRVDDELGSSNRQTSRVRYAVAVGILALFGLAYAAIFLGGMADDGGLSSADSSATIQPDPDTVVHFHGTIEVTVEGESIDFSEPEYTMQDDCFHFHDDDAAADGVWHVHCGDVSLEYALETLGIDATADTVEIDGETYSDDSDTSVSITVDGDSVDPEEYVLEGVGPVDQAQQGAGDNVRIVVESDG